MTQRSRTHVVAFAMLAQFAVTCPLQAQDEIKEDRPHWRRACAAATAALEGRPPEAEAVEALQALAQL